jgi:hypothetical protein
MLRTARRRFALDSKLLGGRVWACLPLVRIALLIGLVINDGGTTLACAVVLVGMVIELRLLEWIHRHE